MHVFYKTSQDFEFSGETVKEKKKNCAKKKEPLELKGNLSYPSLVMFSSGAVLWFDNKCDGPFGAHTLRRVKLTSCLSPYVRAGDSPGGDEC